jgi:alpha-D-xyloside xylohydrolase
MKFTDGNWMTREGFAISGFVEAHEVIAEPDGLIAYVTPHHINSRGSTLDGGLFTVRITSPMPDVIRVRLSHHEGLMERGPVFGLVSKDVEPVISNTDDEATLTSGALSVRIRKKGGWAVEFLNGGKRITGSGNRNMAYINHDDDGAYMREQLDLGVGENIYGLGERFTPFVKNGQSTDTWNRDGGTGTEQAYKSIPFYVSNRGYGVFVNHPENVLFEVASERVSKVQFSVEGESLDYFIIGGASLKHVLENYTTLTGKPALPPAWSFGLWLTTSFTTNYDEGTVTSFVNGMAERDLPLHVFHFDCFWMKEFQWCNFEWDERVFPQPEAMLKRLKEKGLKICVWINPYIGQRSPLFREATEHGYLLKRPNGNVWQWDKWQAGMGVVDFTNPDACDWFAGKLKRLVDMGVDSFKTDFGERIPIDVVYYDGSDPQKMHNYYTFLYNKVVFEALEQKLGRGEAALFARSATAGGQQFPVHWGGDCSANYESMAESLRGGLSLGLSGFGFWSHDIGGFESTASADVYKRWTAFGMLSSHSRLHGNHSYRVPWLFDEEAVDVMRFFTKLKCRLMPYLFGAAVEASTKGVPMMRAMVLEFADDPACAYLDRQYMLGQSLLVAPIFREDGEAAYYLPKGVWTNYLTGERVEGGKWVQEQYDYMSIPLFVRPNSIVAHGREDSRPDYDFADGVELQVFELEDGGTASATVPNVKGEAELSVSLTRSVNIVTITAEGAGKPWSAVLRGVREVASTEGASLESTLLGIRLVPTRTSCTITFKL